MRCFKSLPGLDFVFDEPEVSQNYKRNYSVLYAHNNLMYERSMAMRRLFPLHRTLSTKEVKFLISAFSRCRYKSALFR